MTELGDRIKALGDRAKQRNAANLHDDMEKAVVLPVDVELKRQELRTTMPEIAVLVDLFRAKGFDPKVLAAAENGKSVVNRAACQRFGIDVSDYEQAKG